MIIQCNRCQTRFELDDRRVPDGGTKVRCARCKHVFRVQPPRPHKPPAPPPIEDPFEDEYGPEETVAISDIDRGAIGRPGPAPPVSPPPSPPPEPPPAPKVAQPSKPERRGRYVPFKRKLIYFSTFLIAYFGIFIIPAEVIYRPLEHLFRLIENGETLVSGTEAAFSDEDLTRINRFGLATIERRAELTLPPLYYSLAFNMVLIEGRLLPENEVMTRLDYLDDFEEGFRYDRLVQAKTYWDRRFAEDPAIEVLLSRCKHTLVKAKENARATGYTLSEIYIMLDSGRKVGFFENRIAYLLDSINWWEISTYIGEPYKISGNQFWRALALAGEEGYDHNPIHYWIFPRYDEDAWGTWFSVWMTRRTDQLYNVFSIDFNAASVKRLRSMILLTVLGILLFLAVIVAFIARWLSGLVTKPITELTRGAEEVSRGNYDYEVPVIKDDEFGELTRHFNRMTRGQKERLNLMETLKKFLSEDLAKKAAEGGIVLGGQKAECTVMFTDFAGFSTITQNVNATEAVNVLNVYFAGLVPIIKKYGGFPDKYIGDAIVALFGAPVAVENHGERAVACAIEMQWKMREINAQRRREGKTVFEMRIGLNSGEVLVGAIGCDMKLEYTSIGETTNLANRMESICDIGHVMMAEGTYMRIKDTFFPRAHISETPQRMMVKGYPEPVATYKIFVDNMEISKTPGERSFYRYTEVDHRIKHSPEDVGRAFRSIATYR